MKKSIPRRARKKQQDRVAIRTIKYAEELRKFGNWHNLATSKGKILTSSIDAGRAFLRQFMLSQEYNLIPITEANSPAPLKEIQDETIGAATKNQLASLAADPQITTIYRMKKSDTSLRTFNDAVNNIMVTKGGEVRERAITKKFNAIIKPCFDENFPASGLDESLELSFTPAEKIQNRTFTHIPHTDASYSYLLYLAGFGGVLLQRDQFEPIEIRIHKDLDFDFWLPTVPTPNAFLLPPRSQVILAKDVLHAGFTPLNANQAESRLLIRGFFKEAPQSQLEI